MKENRNQNGRVFLTGDTHGDFSRIEEFCLKQNTDINDVMIILGDAGINYYGNRRDRVTKQFLKTLPVTLFCIHGNHEMRPQKIEGYREKTYRGGTVFWEEEFPNIFFAKDGEVFEFSNNKCLVIGGAYSVDKHYRLYHGYRWFDDEQPDDEIKRTVEDRPKEMGFSVDVILSHTCPKSYEPIEAFLPGLNQSIIDKSTEEWLEQIRQKTKYKKWYCGHWHISKRIDNFVFMFDDYDAI